jgi:signal transduction histidine kinase
MCIYCSVAAGDRAFRVLSASADNTASVTVTSERRRGLASVVDKRIESTGMNSGAFSGTFARARPKSWGISTRSAIVSATVVFVALAISSGGLLFVLYRSLVAGVDDAAASRVRDIVAGLAYDQPAELDGALLTTDQRVIAVQIIDGNGNIIQRSDSAPTSPLVPLNSFGSSLRSGIPDDESPDNDMRISGQTTDTSHGRYTVIAGAGSESMEKTVITVAVMLAIAAPIVMAVAAAASYMLVKRSLRSVEAIRNRVAEISASELSERVPVPPQRGEISALATTMNEMLERVEEGHAAQRRFVGDASHELRSPLTTIITALEFAQDHPDLLDDELKQGLLIPEALRMRDLVEDLLLLARADERGLMIKRDAVYVDVIAEVEEARLRRNCDLEVHTDIQSVTFAGDVGGVSRVLRNLLDNAVRHANSRVELSVARRADDAVVSVGDDGAGIPDADKVRVFDRFVRLDSDRAREGGGTGLGLAIAAEIVAAHDGTIKITDRCGGGTAVTVTFPGAE